MSLAVSQGTSLFIIMQKASLEYQLMMITNELQQLSTAASEESAQMLSKIQHSVALGEGNDDDPSYAADVWSSEEYYALSSNMRLQYQAKERMLNTKKQQLESQQKALATLEDSIDKMIDSSLKDFSYFK